MVASSWARVRLNLGKVPGRLSEHNLTLVAAGVAFYGFLALVPMLIAFVSIYGLVADPDDIQRQVGDVASALPAEVRSFLAFQLTSIANTHTAGVSVTLVIAIVLALWSASGGMAALITGIQIAHEQHEPEGFAAKRGKALLLTLGAIVFMGVVILVIAAVPPLASDAGRAGRVAIGILRWPILAAVMIVGIGLLYRFAVRDRPRGWLGFVTTGTVVAMAGWLVASGLFAWYTANFASYSKTYGSLASVVVLLLWLWLSSLLILIGAVVDGGGAAARRTRSA